MSTNTTNICYSGGAVGADKAWGEIAIANKHRLIHYVFKNHHGSNGPHAVVLEKDQLYRADPHLAAANKILKRSWPAHSDFVSNLLRRNYFQIRDTEAVYAVAGIDGNTVFGGTAWAVEMFKNINPSSENIFVFDESANLWYRWRGYNWSVENKYDIPRPSGKWTGIGSRELGKKGSMAIGELFE